MGTAVPGFFHGSWFQTIPHLQVRLAEKGGKCCESLWLLSSCLTLNASPINGRCYQSQVSCSPPTTPPPDLLIWQLSGKVDSILSRVLWAQQCLAFSTAVDFKQSRTFRCVWPKREGSAVSHIYIYISYRERERERVTIVVWNPPFN